MMHMIRVLTFFVLPILAGCSTYVENEASAQFQPVMPQSAYLDGPSNGSIYHPGVSGLFATIPMNSITSWITLLSPIKQGRFSLR